MTAGPPGWLRALQLVVDRPGQLDVGAVADALWPVPKAPCLPTSSAPVVAARWERLGCRPPVPPAVARRARARWRAAVVEHQAVSRRRAAGLLRELRRRRLVQPSGAHRLDREAARLVDARGVEEALSESLPVVDRRGRLVGHRVPPPPGRFRVDIVAALSRGALGTAALRAQTGGNSGAGERGDWRIAFRRLVAEGWVVPASHRWPTLAGVQLVQRERAAGGRLGAPHTRSPAFADRGEGHHTPDRLSAATGETSCTVAS